MRVTDMKCGTCGAAMHEYEILDRNGNETGETEIVCPNEWRGSHG